MPRSIDSGEHLGFETPSERSSYMKTRQRNLPTGILTQHAGSCRSHPRGLRCLQSKRMPGMKEVLGGRKSLKTGSESAEDTVCAKLSMRAVPTGTGSRRLHRRSIEAVVQRLSNCFPEKWDSPLSRPRRSCDRYCVFLPFPKARHSFIALRSGNIRHIDHSRSYILNSCGLALLPIVRHPPT